MNIDELREHGLRNGLTTTQAKLVFERLECEEFDRDGYRAELERLSAALAALRESPDFWPAPGEAADVASDPHAVIASAKRQLAALRAENERMRCAIDDMACVIGELHDALTEALYPVDDLIDLNDGECMWCGAVNGHDDTCPMIIAKRVRAKYDVPEDE